MVGCLKQILPCLCSDVRLDIQEYLLLKGVEAVAIHGSKCMSRSGKA